MYHKEQDVHALDDQVQDATAKDAVVQDAAANQDTVEEAAETSVQDAAVQQDAAASSQGAATVLENLQDEVHDVAAVQDIERRRVVICSGRPD